MQVHHGTYQKLKYDNPDGSIGGYTRILQCVEIDDIMHMVPTIRVDPLLDPLTASDEPISKAWAYTQWLARAVVPERYIFLTKPDYIFRAPLPLVATADRLFSYPQLHIDCTRPYIKPHCENLQYNPAGVAPVDVPKVSPAAFACDPWFVATDPWSRLSMYAWLFPRLSARKHRSPLSLLCARCSDIG